ncbi:MAG: hypothetical protein RLZZ248_878 [Bacteroidota bacterium]|jgi:hemoglobin/transferrin/lactoferrin receptor protein
MTFPLFKYNLITCFRSRIEGQKSYLAPIKIPKMQLRVQMALGLYFIWANCTGQSITILDSISQKQLEYVYISLPKDNWQAISNDRGQFDLPQKYWTPSDTLYLEMLNYKPKVITHGYLVSNDFVVYMQPEYNQLKEVVVTASRWSNNKNEIPFSFAVLDQRFSEIVQPQTTADLLEKSGQVFVQKSQLGGGSPMIRGFSANRILLLVDGVRMNSAIFRSGNLHNIIVVDPRSVDQTEVYLGPASVVFGSDAIGGSINFKTLEPNWNESDSNQTVFQVGTNIGSANNERTIQTSGKWSNRRWGWVGNFSFSQFGDLIMGKYGGFNSYLRKDYLKVSNPPLLNDQLVTNHHPRKQISTGYDQWNILQKIYYRPHPNLSFSLAFHRSESSNIPRYDRLLVRDSDSQLRSAEWYYGPQIWQMIHFKSEAQLNRKWADVMTTSLAFQRQRESRHDRSRNNPLRYHRDEWVNMVNLSLDIEKRWNKGLLLQYGLEGVFNRIYSSGRAEDITNNQRYAIHSRYPNHSNWQSAAWFTQLKKSTENFSVTAGIRGNYSGANATFDSSFFAFPYDNYIFSATNLSGGIGLNYRPNSENTWGINWSSGFRAPNLDDMAKVFDSEPGNVIVPNLNLKPEKAITLDFNYQFEATSKKAAISFHIFHTLLSQALVRRDFSFNGMDSIFYDGVKSRVQAIVNATSARVSGVGMDWKVSLSSFLNWMGNINYQKGYEIEGNEKLPLRHAAPLFGMTSFQFRKNKISSRLAFRYNGKIKSDAMPLSELSKPHLYPMDADGQLFSPAWLVVDWYFGYQISQKMKLRGGIENILDRQYRSYSSGIVAPGRNFFINLTYQRGN